MTRRTIDYERLGVEVCEAYTEGPESFADFVSTILSMAAPPHVLQMSRLRRPLDAGSRKKAPAEKLFVAGAAIAVALASTLIAEPASAKTYNCGTGTVLVGEAGRNPVVSTRVDIRNGSWSVAHTLSDGQQVSRGDQYQLASWQEPSSRYVASWQGRLIKNPSLYMQGGIWYDDYGAHYDEFIYDNANGNKIIMHSTTLCTAEAADAQVATAPDSTSTPEATSTPELTSTPSSSVPMVSDGGTFRIPVTINGQLTLNFVVDSGATDVSIPADVVLTLWRAGTITEADFFDKKNTIRSPILENLG
jgi:hypothetical protein